MVVVSAIAAPGEATGDTDDARSTSGSARPGASNPASRASARQSRRTLAALRRSQRPGAERTPVKVRKLGPTENELHVSVANLLDWALLQPAFWTTFPAGWGKFSGAMAQLLKRMGLKAGIPDILVFPGEGRCFGIELKAGKNTLTPEQKETHIKLVRAGVRVHLCRSVEDVMIVLANEGVPLRNIRVGDATWQPNPRNAPPVEIYVRHGGIAAGEGEHGTE